MLLIITKKKSQGTLKKKKEEAPKASLVNFAFRGILVIVYFEKKMKTLKSPRFQFKLFYFKGN
jgi:hypothetical protein